MSADPNKVAFRKLVMEAIQDSNEPVLIDQIVQALVVEGDDLDRLKSSVQGALMFLSKEGRIVSEKRYDPLAQVVKAYWSATSTEVDVPKTRPPEKVVTTRVSSVTGLPYVEIGKTSCRKGPGITLSIHSDPMIVRGILEVMVRTPDGNIVPAPVFQDLDLLLTGEIPEYMRDARYARFEEGVEILLIVPVSEARKHFEIESKVAKAQSHEVECAVIVVPISKGHVGVMSLMSDADRARYTGDSI